MSSVHPFVHVGPKNITMGCSNLVHIQTRFESPCTRLGHLMVIFSRPTWTNAHCLIMSWDWTYAPPSGAPHHAHLLHLYSHPYHNLLPLSFVSYLFFRENFWHVFFAKLIGHVSIFCRLHEPQCLSILCS